MMFRLSSGRGLAYATRGTGRSIVLLHPIGLDGSFWDEVVAVLSRHWRTISIDLPGHGHSDVPAPSPTLANLGADVAELIATLGQPPVALVGCSLGGMVAQAIALDRPDLVGALVLANTSHDRDAASCAALHKRAESALAGMPALIDETLERWFGAAYASVQPGKVERLRERLEAADPVVHAWMWHAIADLDHGERLRALPQPSLVIAGSDDRSVPVAATEAMARDLSHVETFSMTAGHLSPYERPDEFASLVTNFLARQFTTNERLEDKP
jgi:3-oxoadipate enol-lactonase